MRFPEERVNVKGIDPPMGALCGGLSCRGAVTCYFSIERTQ